MSCSVWSTSLDLSVLESQTGNLMDEGAWDNYVSFYPGELEGNKWCNKMAPKATINPIIKNFKEQNERPASSRIIS